MFGLAFIIIGFLFCLGVSYFMCRASLECEPLGFGISATLGVFLFVILIFLVQTFSPSP